jgi:CheY-like chemotaxis protein
MTILVVDDAADIRLLVRRILGAAGYAVREAAGGAEGLRALADGPLPDLVLLDVQMPDQDGWSVLSAIRADPATAGLRVILCTVKARPDDVARAWRLGCDGLVTKPFAVADLVAEVGRVLSMKEAQWASRR